MKKVQPKYYIVSIGEGWHPQFFDFLEDNQIQWRPNKEVSFLENLWEFAGRLCYEAWKQEDGSFNNKNLTKIREGNDTYLKNILESRHGSVLEHSGIVVLFNNCSRIFTHEIVRHRVGTAFSQTSGRYVKHDDIAMWVPPVFDNDEDMEVISNMLNTIEQGIKNLCKNHQYADMKNFTEKKKFTSALRRFTPNGVANNILMTFNGRSFRHVEEMRCSEAAEEEMHLIMRPLLIDFKKIFPNLLQDLNIETFQFKNSKV
jgi:thymidylate synthase (FAD)